MTVIDIVVNEVVVLVGIGMTREIVGVVEEDDPDE
jgi:hypothetical protein